jgi:hypothetical protein
MSGGETVNAADVIHPDTIDARIVARLGRFAGESLRPIRITGWQVNNSALCPAFDRLDSRDFTWSPRTMKRVLAETLIASASITDVRLTDRTAHDVRMVIARRNDPEMGSGLRGAARWLHETTAAGRVAAAAAALTYAVELTQCAQKILPRDPADLVVGGNVTITTPLVPFIASGRLFVEMSNDLEVRIVGLDSFEHPTPSYGVIWDAVTVPAMSGRFVGETRDVSFWAAKPGFGKCVPIDASHAVRALDIAVDRAIARLEQQQKLQPAVMPGGHCIRCDRFTDCGPGTAYIEQHEGF